MEQCITTYARRLLSLVPLAGLLIGGIWKIYRTRREAQWGKLKTFCVLTPNSIRNGARIEQTGPASLLVEAVNHGTGEVTIFALKGRYKDGSVSDITLQTTDKKLRQGDRLARAIMPMDQSNEQYAGFCNEAGSELFDMWFEDTFGRKHPIKNVKKHLMTLCEMA